MSFTVAELDDMSIYQLRKVAKFFAIDLYGVRLKEDIINRIYEKIKPVVAEEEEVQMSVRVRRIKESTEEQDGL